MAKKKTNLQPWLDYFKMLQRYEQKGFLEVKPQEHEAYVTRAALLTLVGIDAEDVQSAAVSPQPEALADTLSRLRAYAAYRWAPAVGQQHPADMNDPDAPLPAIPKAELTAYLSQNFALHMVSEDAPHKPLCTLLLSIGRGRLGRRTEHIEVISYVEEKAE